MRTLRSEVMRRYDWWNRFWSDVRLTGIVVGLCILFSKVLDTGLWIG